jgi:hypothetical protein
VEPPISVATSECCDAHQRLLATVAGLDDATARQPSRLADWAVGDINDEINTAYPTKYRRYGARFVDPVVSPEARSATLRLVPRSTSS